MNVRHLLAIALSILALGIIWFITTEPETPPPLKASQIEPSTTSPGDLSTPSESNNALPEALPLHSALPEQTKIQAAVVDPKPAENNLPAEQTEALLEQSLQELRLEEGLSSFNLMLLKDLAMRLNEGQPKDPNALTGLSMNTEWPDEYLDTLQRLSAALHAETALHKEWQQKLSQDPQAYREAYLNQQKQLLGSELFEKIHAEDTISIDEAGLSAHFSSKEDNPELRSEPHQKKLQLLQQWQQNQLSEAELTNELGQSLSTEEINQLIETGKHEANWLSQIGAFLEEYRYIEQSGIIGSDELQMRQELIEKHFQPENRGIVDQFLFGPQPTKP